MTACKRPYDAEVGDRVRVTFETTLISTEGEPEIGSVFVGDFDGADWWLPADPDAGDREIVNVEVVGEARNLQWVEGYEWALTHLSDPGVLADAQILAGDQS